MSFVPWHSIGNLTVDMDGILWRRYKRGWEYLGPVEDAHLEGQGGIDLAALADLWRDRFDPREVQMYLWE